jgi:hypothetical protein
MKIFGISTIINNLLLKKMFSIFLVAAIFFNGFIPKSAEFKNNFIEAINCAVSTQTNFIDKYAESVVSVTNGIASNILSALNKAGLTEEKISKANKATNSDKQKTEPVNTSADNGIIIKSNTNNSITLNLLKTKVSGLAYSKVYNETNLYSNTGVVRTKGTAETGIFFFILFAILVVRIKDTIAVLYNNNRIALENRLG